jgi:hypothetical protein
MIYLQEGKKERRKEGRGSKQDAFREREETKPFSSYYFEYFYTTISSSNFQPYRPLYLPSQTARLQTLVTLLIPHYQPSNRSTRQKNKISTEVTGRSDPVTHRPEPPH